MNHVLITGAAGFIGSHLSEALLQDGWAVTAVDNFDSFYCKSVKTRNISCAREYSNYRFVEADIRDLPSLQDRLAGDYGTIVHLAAKAGVRPSIENPVAYQEVNVGGTQNILELARKWSVRQFVFASSSSVYGVNPTLPWREDDHVLLPISPYASTKISGELMGHVYSRLYGMRFIALRFFTVYGPRQRPDLAIHLFTRLLFGQKPLPLFGDGSSRRDYTYIDDIVAGIQAAMAYEASNYEVINLGNNRTVTLLELVETLERVSGLRAILDRFPPQAGDVPQTYANIDKAAGLLGYSPLTDFNAGLKSFLDWFVEELSLANECP
jgi:UDP-glucuronate 4-epimerase